MTAKPRTFQPPWAPRVSDRDRKAEIDRRRGKTAERGYGAAWRRIREAVLRDEPLCRFCTEKGLTVAAEEVDHIDGNSRNNERSNLRPLCKPCHSRRTAADQGFNRGKRRREAPDRP